MTNGNLAYNTYSNAIFNVALYEAQHGAIETVEQPEKVWLHEIRKKRRREISKLELERKERIQWKLRHQKKLGLLSLLVAIISIVIGFFGIKELYTISIPFLIGGIGLIATRKIVV